ncbi:MAG TPA: ComEA family DNA-binding protein [Actinospica sp.]|jgi:competence protein ComEA|nr:ComEA family DNA-binding protein [Actinospica sp.]
MTQNDRHWRWATPQAEGVGAAPYVSGDGSAHLGGAASASLLPPVISRRDRLRSAIEDRLPTTLRGRWAVDRTTGIVLAVSVLLGALLIGGWAVLRAKPHEMSVARERPLGLGTGDRDLPGSPAAESVPSIPIATAAPTGSAAGVIVDVEGKVARPGVRTLPSGSRILDALSAAGGALPGTDLTSLNQAQILSDGEQVLVGVTPPPQVDPGSPSGRGKKSRGRAGTGGAQPVHLNTAGIEDLEQLPGIGPVLAQRIVDYRTEHGAFHSVDELRQVSGFGGQRFENIAPMVAL